MMTEITVKLRKGNKEPVVIGVEKCNTVEEWQQIRTPRELVAMLNAASESYCRLEALRLVRSGKPKQDVEALYIRAPGPLKKSAAEIEIEKLNADPQLRMEFFREFVADKDLMKGLAEAVQEKKEGRLQAQIALNPDRDLTPEEMKASVKAE